MPLYGAQFLLEQGEFYPFGFYIDDSGNVRNVAIHDGDEFPLSNTYPRDIDAIIISPP